VLPTGAEEDDGRTATALLVHSGGNQADQNLAYLACDGWTRYVDVAPGAFSAGVGRPAPVSV
jgi:hypothetical protein